MRIVAPKYIYGNNNESWNDISDRLKLSKRIILFLDYDGTLVPIMEKPSLAILPPSMKKLLLNLNKAKDINVFIVTGRAYSSIKKVFNVKNISIASNHGFQITGKNKNWFHPEIKRFLPSLKKTKLLLLKKLSSIPLAYVEDKKITITVHYRNVEKRLIPLVKNTVEHVVVNYKEDLYTTLGKMIIEVRPKIKWNKGDAVLKIMKSLRVRNTTKTVIYIGDDKTDEDAFKALQQYATTIVVGRNHISKASFYLRDTDEVRKLLESIYSLKNERS
jgi:trehalose-phosphatase